MVGGTIDFYCFGMDSLIREINMTVYLSDYGVKGLKHKLGSLFLPDILRMLIGNSK
jgi:hypothetical protein